MKKYKIEIGTKFHWYDMHLWHIIKVFTDENNELVIIKTWSKYKKCWKYDVVSFECLKWWFDSKTFKEVNK